MPPLNNLITSVSISSPSASTVTFDNANYVLNEIKGLESPLVRLPRFNLPGSSGAFISNALYGERSITIKGTIISPDNNPSTFLTNRNNLINVLAYSRDNNNNLQSQTLMITLGNGQILTTNVFVDKPLQLGYSEDQYGWEEFMISFIAPDPNLYSSTSISTSISLPVGGGTAIPTAVPASLAPSSGGSATIDNIGSQSSAPTITLTAPLTNPYVTNNRSGLFLKINYTLNLGDHSLVINCSTQRITQGATDKTGIQSSDSTFWSLLSGDNLIGFSATAGSGTCTINFAPTFIGV